MKNYFDFQLKGKQFFPLWMVFYFLFVIPYGLMIFKLLSFGKGGVPQKHPPIILLLIIPLILVAMVWTFYFIKLMVQNISLKETTIQCDYKLGKYLGVVFTGIFLSIITVGIYLPWFMRNMQRFFIDNSSYKDKNFSFQGQGGKLLLILFLSFIVPMILITVIAFKMHGIDLKNQPICYRIMHQMITFIIIVPYMYLIYKWRVDFKYKEYHIKWDTEFWPSIGKILLEVVLSIITCGIYLPLAYLRLYKYFTEKTKSNSIDNQSIQFGYDIDQKNDFLMIWGQLLITVVTLGIYYPWAVCKVSQRVLSKSYIEKIND